MERNECCTCDTVTEIYDGLEHCRECGCAWVFEEGERPMEEKRERPLEDTARKVMENMYLDQIARLERDKQGFIEALMWTCDQLRGADHDCKNSPDSECAWCWKLWQARALASGEV